MESFADSPSKTLIDPWPNTFPASSSGVDPDRDKGHKQQTGALEDPASEALPAYAPINQLRQGKERQRQAVEVTVSLSSLVETFRGLRNPRSVGQ